MSYSLATPFSPYAQSKQQFDPSQGPFTGQIAGSNNPATLKSKLNAVNAPPATPASALHDKVNNVVNPTSFHYDGQVFDGTGGGRFTPQSFQAPQSFNGYTVPSHQQAAFSPSAQVDPTLAGRVAGAPQQQAPQGSAPQYRRMGTGWMPSQQTVQAPIGPSALGGQ